MRRTLGDWLTHDCALDPHVAAEMVIAAHEATNACLNPPGVGCDRDGVAVRGDFDGDQIAVTLVPTDMYRQVLDDARKWSTQLVLQLVDEAEVEVRDGAAQVSLRRDAR